MLKLKFPFFSWLYWYVTHYHSAHKAEQKEHTREILKIPVEEEADGQMNPAFEISINEDFQKVIKHTLCSKRPLQWMATAR